MLSDLLWGQCCAKELRVGDLAWTVDVNFIDEVLHIFFSELHSSWFLIYHFKFIKALIQIYGAWMVYIDLLECFLIRLESIFIYESQEH